MPRMSKAQKQAQKRAMKEAYRVARAGLDEIAAAAGYGPGFTGNHPMPEGAAPSEAAIRLFYESIQWKRLSYRTRLERGQRCECCGATPRHHEGVRIVCDHVKPVRWHWKLRFDPENLQVLCDDCNKGKGAYDETDWRQR